MEHYVNKIEINFDVESLCTWVLNVGVMIVEFKFTYSGFVQSH